MVSSPGDAPAALGADVYVIHLQLVRPKPAAACFRRKSAPANDLGGEVGDRLSSEPPQGGGLHVVYDLVQDGEDVSTHRHFSLGAQRWSCTGESFSTAR